MHEINIHTDNDAIGVASDPRGEIGGNFTAIAYSGGGYSYIPNGFFRSWQNEQAHGGELYIGRCSSFGIGSYIKFDGNGQKINIGRYVTAGMNVKLLPGNNHRTDYITTCHLDSYDNDMPRQEVKPRHITIGNDVWIGDEAMILGGAEIADGCVIGARSLIPGSFRSLPYGIYAGNPAKLIGYRFAENIIAKLLEIKWWERPFLWIKENKELFSKELTGDMLANYAG